MHMGRAAMLLTAICGAVTSVSAPAAAQTRQQSTVLNSESESGRAFQDEYGYSSAVVTPDGTVYMSGVVAGLGPDGDITAAYERTYAYIGETLKRAGASWDDVVEITTFHTDLTSQLKPISEVQKRYIKPPYAAWTAIQVARLVPDRGITEIKIIAKLPRSER
ncbi:MAG: Rid family hydrolase [Pseudomonadota bacterium]